MEAYSINGPYGVQITKNLGLEGQPFLLIGLSSSQQ